MGDSNLIHNTTRSVLAHGTSTVVSEGFAKLMIILGFPQATILTPLVRGATIGVMNYCYDDITSRALSKLENDKVKQVAGTALHTFMELAEEDGVTPISMQIEQGQLEYAYEVSEELMLTAIRQSQRKKVDILGRYYGRAFYKGDIDWQDMHQMINMVGALTLRQIVLIRLISEGFKGLDNKLFISNPSACVEINRLKDYGIWQTEGASFGTNDSLAIQLKSIIPTIYTDKVCEVLMLDKLSDEDIARTIDGIKLTPKGEPQRVLTMEDYKQHTEWQHLDNNGNLIVNGGGAAQSEEQAIRDIIIGK